MRFWISGEVHQDVIQDYLLAVDAVSQTLNAELGSVEYGIPVKSSNVIGILLPPAVPGFGDGRTKGKSNFAFGFTILCFKQPSRRRSGNGSSSR